MNGVGPYWFPAWLRAWLTRQFNRVFDEASPVRHDESYARGYPARDVCDRGMLAAMLRDTSRMTSTGRMFAATVVSWLFWGFNRLFGWVSYNRGNR
jgi:hypothetical protein